MIGRPNLQTRVTRRDDARYQGGTRIEPVRAVIWHATAGDTVEGARSWLDRMVRDEDGNFQLLEPKKRASYHYMIGKDGKIVRTVHPAIVAFHAGDSSWPSLGHWLNRCSLGVAFANDNGSDDNPEDDALTEAQLESGLWLGTVLLESNPRLTVAHNLSHREVSPGRKPDIAPHILDMDVWRQQLALKTWPTTIRTHAVIAA